MSDVQVGADATLHVTETIVVHAEGDRIRRGIFRDFPLTFEDARGRVRQVGFRLLDVTRDGRPEPHFTERQGEYLRIYAGDEGVLVPRGEHTYVITYETDRQIRWFDGRPELNWNVTGNAWDFPIEATLARITLPGNAEPVRWTAYSGPFGARGRDWRGAFQDGSLIVETTGALAPREGLTVVAELPAGAVALPDTMDEARFFLLDYRAWIIGGVGLLAVLTYYLTAWHAVGRDPKGGTVIPLFHPPEGISPALANYIHNWGFGRNPWKAFTASALSLAVRGLLVFDDETKGTLTLDRTDKAVDLKTLPGGERAILNWVEGKLGRGEISRANGKEVAGMTSQFRKSVKAEAGDRYFRRNMGWLVVGVALSAAVVLAILVFGGLSEEDIGILIGLLFVGVFFGVFAGPIVATILQSPTAGQVFSAAVSLLILVYILFQMLGSFLGASGTDTGTILSSLPQALGAHAFVFALVVTLPVVNGLFFYLMRAPTPAGRPVMDQLEGLRLYMETAESGRLNIAGAPDLDAAHFEALLPYAVALGVERPWADAFAAALARAHPGDANPISHYHSRWNRGRAWSSDNFGRSIVSSMAGAAGAVAASMPRSSSGSSGFGGGGGSGRGGGGGGGGGW